MMSRQAQHPHRCPPTHPQQDVNPNGEGLLADLLWADPSPHVSGWCANPRGVSFVFGLDVAQAWLKAQGLRAIVRAHMVQQTGFEVRAASVTSCCFAAQGLACWLKSCLLKLCVQAVLLITSCIAPGAGQQQGDFEKEAACLALLCCCRCWATTR